MGYKVSWLLDDYCHNKVKFNHFQSMFINPFTRKLHTFNLEKKQIINITNTIFRRTNCH